MKKSLLAAALTLATGGAIAQSSVTLYGVIDEGYTKETSKVAIPIPEEYAETPGQTYNIKHISQGFSHSVSTANRFGIKTQEDLGEGLTAKATIEFGFGEPNENQSAIHALRQAWVGIGNSEGHMIKLGRIQSQSFEILAETDASGSGRTAGSIFTNRDSSLDSRQGIMYHYKQPGYGFSVGYYYNDKQAQETDSYDSKYKGQGIEIGAHFDDGFAFGRVVYATGTLDKTYYEYGEKRNEAKRNLLTTNFGVKFEPGTKISYTYQKHKLTNTETRGGTVNTSFTDTMKGDAHQINLNHMVTPKFEVLASYTIGLIADNHTYNLNSEGYDSDTILKAKGKGYQIGGRYHFSKRTNLYALYGHESWKIDFPEYEFNNISAKQKTVSVGLKHMF